MIDKFEFRLPEKAILLSARHIVNAIHVGQESAEDESVFILEGGSLAALWTTAGAIAYGINHPGEKITLQKACNLNEPANKNVENELNKINEIQRELDLYMNPFRDGKEGKTHNCPHPDKERDYMVLLSDEVSIHVDEKNNEDLHVTERITSTFIRLRNKKLMQDGDNKLDGLFLYGDITYELEDKLFEHIRSILRIRNDKHIPLFIAVNGMSEALIRRLVFEEDAKVVHALEPDMNFYEKIFTYELQKRQVVLAPEASVLDVICRIRSFRAEHFVEEDLTIAIDRAIRHAGRDGHTRLTLGDFELCEAYDDPEDALSNLIGLTTVKKKVARMVNLTAFNIRRYGPSYKHRSYHIAFAGSPGVGKTEVARLYARILAKKGVSNGKLTVASKSDYVGRYVGETAWKMRNLFRANRGGVLLFDEAATFLNDDSYTREALIELVRFMEMYPDVICIFASYEDKIRSLLDKDSGLKSRISEIIVFEDYADEELYAILQKFCMDEEYVLEDCRDVFFPYINEQRRNYPDSFGNARLSRNVFEKAKEVLASEVFEKNVSPAEITQMPRSCVEQAVFELNEAAEKKTTHRFGFSL